MLAELNHIHKQRIREAVKAAKQGATVIFGAYAAETQVIAWRIAGSTSHHVLCNFEGPARPWLDLVEREFAAQMLLD